MTQTSNEVPIEATLIADFACPCAIWASSVSIGPAPCAPTLRSGCAGGRSS